MIAKILLISRIYSALLATISLLGCGSGVENVDVPPTLRGKPTAINKDHSSTVQALLIVNSIAYLNHATRTIFSLGDDLLDCQTGVPSRGLPTDQTIASFEFKVTSECGPRENKYLGYKGVESFTLMDVNRVAPQRNVAIKFAAGTLTTPAPLKLFDRLRDRMTVSHALQLTAEDVPAGTYAFELRSTWSTTERDPENGLVGTWETTVSGRLTPDGRPTRGAKISDLASSVDTTLRYIEVGFVSPTEETARLTLALSAQEVQLSAAGYPTDTMTGSYTTSLFPGDQFQLNLFVNRYQINNPPLSSQLGLAPPGKISFPWVANATQVISYQRRTRSL